MGKAPEEPTRIYKGIYLNCTLWRARLWNGDHEIYIGHFETPKAAAQAYDRASMRIKGPDMAHMEGLNFNITSYQDELTSIMEAPVEQFIESLKSTGVTTNPVDPAKPLK